MDLLGLIKTFIRVVENGSIAAAARAQGMSPAAISQSLTRLETHLGVRLLSRTTRSMVLTESGTRYFDKVRLIPHEVDLAAQAAAIASAPQGPLCIATTTAFGRHVLAPLLPSFKATYPGIDIELISSDRRVDHRLEGVDVSIRIEAQLSDQLIARPIGAFPFVVCASPAYLERAGTPETPEALEQHDCLVFRYPTDGRFLPWFFVRDGQRFEARLRPGFVCDDIDTIAQLAVAAGGIARLASYVAQPWLDAGLLRPLFTPQEQTVACAAPEPLNIFACVTERSALNAKVRAFIDYLEQAIIDRQV
ncbi:LysR family transcriptional regulator [Pseudomonas sp. dw_358]|uniref:LysR family transcriptional regulator n=1 Tax=Pseudomonas sp. dw_358 TaxID=2720083 RepID=UPI001BD6ADBA|nr:LysR family transcriptional regulator [Pseudomonas sp. dw_358]